MSVNLGGGRELEAINLSLAKGYQFCLIFNTIIFLHYCDLSFPYFSQKLLKSSGIIMMENKVKTISVN